MSLATVYWSRVTSYFLHGKTSRLVDIGSGRKDPALGRNRDWNKELTALYTEALTNELLTSQTLPITLVKTFALPLGKI